MFEESAGAGQTEGASAAGDWDEKSVIDVGKNRGSTFLVGVC